MRTLVAGLVLALTAASCTTGEGTVVGKWITVNPLVWHMTLRQADGTHTVIEPTGHAYLRCHLGQHYPECTR